MWQLLHLEGPSAAAQFDLMKERAVCGVKDRHGENVRQAESLILGFRLDHVVRDKQDGVAAFESKTSLLDGWVLAQQKPQKVFIGYYQIPLIAPRWTHVGRFLSLQ